MPEIRSTASRAARGGAESRRRDARAARPRIHAHTHNARLPPGGTLQEVLAALLAERMAAADRTMRDLDADWRAVTVSGFLGSGTGCE